MAISMIAARKLCTASELELVEASRASDIKEITPGRLRQKVQRARTLRDKYRDLAKRQRLQARGKVRASGRRPAQGNENTVRKAELFDEVLGRFQARLAAVDGAAAGAGAGRAGATKSGAAKKSGARKGTAKKGAAKKGGARKGGARKGAARKGAARKGGAKKGGAKKGAARKGAARKGAAKKAARKGGTRRPSRADAANVGAGRTQHAHTKSAGRRRQAKRDRR